MIQRIQSLFYLLAGGAFGSLFFFPFAESEKPIPDYMSDQVYNIMDHGVMMGLTTLGTIGAIVAIFLFNNRKNQLRLGNVVITMAILLPLVAFLLLYVEKTAMDSKIAINDQIGLYVPLVVLLFAFLANRAVKKDDKLVNSMDRLR